MNIASRAAIVFATFILLFSLGQSVKAQDSGYRLPAGTRIRLRMVGDISSKFSSVNDTFLTRVAVPVMVREIVAIPAGMVVEGRVTKVDPASGGQNGRMEIQMVTLRLPNEVSRNIEGLPVNAILAKRSYPLWKVLGGAAIGAAIGGVTGTAKGLLIGAGIGAGAGTGAAAIIKGNEVRLKEDDIIEIELKKDVTLPVLDY
jgi:hypothetical protein